MNRFYRSSTGNFQKWWLLLPAVPILAGVAILLWRGPQESPAIAGSPESGQPAGAVISNPRPVEKIHPEDPVALAPDSPSGRRRPGNQNSEIRRSQEGSSNLSRGAQRFEQGDYQAAVFLLDSIDPKESKVLKMMGISFYRLGELDRAREYLRRALEMGPEDFSLLKYLVYCGYDQERYQDALQWIDQALAIREDPELNRLRDRARKEISNREDYGINNRVNFRVKYDKLAHSEAETRIVSLLEDAYREITRQLDYRPDRITEVILYTRESFFDITRSPSWAGGLYDGRIRLPVKDIGNDQAELKRILTHELTHALVHHLAGSCPYWLNEGLAEYFSLGSRQETVGQVIPLEYLEAGFPTRARAAMVAYRESYSVVKFLIDRYGMYRLKNLLELLGNQKAFSEAFEETYLVSYRRFLGDWGKN